MKALERNSVNPAVSNLLKLGSVVAGNSLGETKFIKPESTMAALRVRNTVASAPLLREDHALHPVGRQSGTHLDNGFAVISAPRENGEGTERREGQLT